MIKISHVQKKQISGLTGLALVGFVIAHLSGNFLIFKGAEALNKYADFLHNLGNLLWAARIGLIVAFVAHMWSTINLAIHNKRARKQRYYKYQNHRNESSLPVRLMPFTGTILLVYIIFHLLDFSLAEKVGFIDGVDYGLYGLVINTLSDPIHAALYIIAMASLGLHLYHAFQSVFQTFGLMSDSNQTKITLASKALGVAVSLGFSSIPLYILFVL